MAKELLYLFTGNAEVFINNRINLIINELSPASYSLIKYDLEQTDVKTIIEDAITPPFFEDYKVIIIKRPTILSNKGTLSTEYKVLLNYLKKPNNQTILIIDATNIQITLDNELYKELKKYAMIIDYSNQENIEIGAWIKRTFEQENIMIDNATCEMLVEYTSSEQIRIINEINKLISYVGPGGIITKDIIKELVNKDLNNEVFNLIKAIINKDKNQIFALLKGFTNQTKDIQGLLALINSTMNDLYTISKLLKRGYSQVDIAKFLNISSGRAYYLIKDVQTFSPDNLEEAIINLSELDYQIKNGLIDKKIGLEVLLLKL